MPIRRSWLRYGDRAGSSRAGPPRPRSAGSRAVEAAGAVPVGRAGRAVRVSLPGGPASGLSVAAELSVRPGIGTRSPSLGKHGARGALKLCNGSTASDAARRYGAPNSHTERNDAHTGCR